MRIIMKRFLAVLLTITNSAYAGVITHSDYTSGATITAAGQNANENLIFNEFNGNIDNTNIKSGGITNTNIAATTISVDKFAQVVQDTFTVVSQQLHYRRPVLVTIDNNTVDVEANTGTSNQTCITFPDVQRCVTEDTSSTSVNRRFIISEVASFSGTKNSGLAPGETRTNNTAYALYAVKATDVSTDFVIAGTTNTPVQANFSTLNTRFGTNGWVYLGLIFNGDRSGVASNYIVPAVQAGNMTCVNMTGNTTAANWPDGGGNAILMANSTNNASIYTYSSGTGITQIPANIGSLFWICQSVTNATGVFKLGSQAFAAADSEVGHLNTFNNFVLNSWETATAGASCRDTASTGATATGFKCWTDNALGIGGNPQL